MDMTKKHFPLDVMILWGDKHLGIGPEYELYSYLSQHTAVRSLGITHYDGANYRDEIISYLNEGRINTIFVEPRFHTDHRALPHEFNEVQALLTRQSRNHTG